MFPQLFEICSFYNCHFHRLLATVLIISIICLLQLCFPFLCSKCFVKLIANWTVAVKHVRPWQGDCSLFYVPWSQRLLKLKSEMKLQIKCVHLNPVQMKGEVTEKTNATCRITIKYKLHSEDLVRASDKRDKYIIFLQTMNTLNMRNLCLAWPSWLIPCIITLSVLLLAFLSVVVTETRRTLKPFNPLTENIKFQWL